MLLKLISCNVFLREACHCIARSPHTVDMEFTELGEHAHSESLRKRLQGLIDNAESNGKKYDAVLLLFGLCGNATVGLRANRTPVVIPRAHDCCTILLGARQRYEEHFGDDPSTPFSSVGYQERGQYFLRVDETGASTVQHGDSYAAMVEQYGEENAKMVWEAMHPQRPSDKPRRAVYIDVPETAQPGREEKIRSMANAEGMQYERLEGNIRLINMLIRGEWDPSEFLVVKPGQETYGIYDFNQIIGAGEADGKS